MDKQCYVYILASKRNVTLYTGFTGALTNGIWQHKNKVADGFTKGYRVCLLVYYEIFGDTREGIRGEKVPKRWRRTWKIVLIEAANPG
jgi:putative endonuclease